VASRHVLVRVPPSAPFTLGATHRSGRAPLLVRPRPRTALLAVSALSGALSVLVLALALGGGRPQPVPEGLPDPGMLTGWALPVSTLLFYLTAIGTVGSLLTAVLLAHRGQALTRRATRIVRATTRWALAWAAAALAVLMLSAADFRGIPVTQLFSTDALWATLTSPASQTRALLIVVAVSAVVAAYARWVTTSVGCAVLLLIAVAGLAPTAFTGHAATAVDPWLAISGLLVHVSAATLWVGGLVGMTVYLRRTPTALAVVAPRFSRLALACFCAIAVSGLVIAVVELGPSVQAWRSGYGALVLVKAGALLVLGVCGWLHRTRTLPALTARRAGSFLKLAAGEVLVMAATLGLAVALARTPSPPAPAAASATGHGDERATSAGHQPGQ
jgi:putative copper export protein